MKFIESIKIKDNSIELFNWHIQRTVYTAKEFAFTPPIIELQQLLHKNPYPKSTTVKCRIEYSRDGVIDISYSPYTIRKVESLKVVDGGNIGYSYKYSNRNELNNLYTQRGECDDIIITKGGLLTDTSFSNIVLERGGELFTPSSYLLNGTRRLSLIQQGLITEKSISINDIATCDRVFLINSMLDIAELVLPTSAIIL